MKEFQFTFDSNKSAEENTKDISKAVEGFVKENFIDKAEFDNMSKELNAFKAIQSEAKAKDIFGQNIDTVKSYLDLSKLDDAEYINKIKADFKLDVKPEVNQPDNKPAPVVIGEPQPKVETPSTPNKVYKFSRYQP